MSASVYPVRVDATLDTQLSRWLWLVKWVLAIPHYIVLAFLWLTFVVLSAIAFFAILFTGRYPRVIFDFNVGVLRWSWRVAYYAYGALATDRYPPFTLAEVPDYPAHLTVDYPEHLSRGLVLVKWWLLAIPHYLIVGFLAGSGVYVAWDTTQGDGAQWTWGSGLIGLLVFFAAVILLFTGRYPQQMFDLILGLNRWVLRVAAYAGLMTDEYPPFRLDMGGPDPGAARVAVPSGPGGGGTTATLPGAAPATVAGGAAGTTEAAGGPGGAPGEGPGDAGPPQGGPADTTPWTAGRVVAVVIGALVFLVSAGFLVAGTTLAVGGATLRNDDGFLMTPSQSLSTSTYAISSEPLVLDSGSAGDVVPESLLGEVAVRADVRGGEPIFVGVATTQDAAAFLADVEHTTLVDIEGIGDDRVPLYRDVPGDAAATSPGDSDIWVASATGTGEQELTWEPESGDWTVVVMNADASAGVDADIEVGATVPVLGAVIAGLFVTGGVLLVASIVLVLVALHGRRVVH